MKLSFLLVSLLRLVCLYCPRLSLLSVVLFVCLCSQESYIRHLTSVCSIRVYVSHGAIQIEGTLLYYTTMILVHYPVSVTKIIDTI